MLNRNDHHTLDAKDHDGSMSHLGQNRKWQGLRGTSVLPSNSDLGSDAADANNIDAPSSKRVAFSKRADVSTTRPFHRNLREGVLLWKPIGR